MENQAKLDDVRLDIQAVDITIDPDFRDRILLALTKLRRYYSGDVITAEVYMEKASHSGPDFRSLRIKFGVPGNDVVADDTGDNWDKLLHNVTDKLRVQLERRFDNSQNAYRQR